MHLQKKINKCKTVLTVNWGKLKFENHFNSQISITIGRKMLGNDHSLLSECRTRRSEQSSRGGGQQLTAYLSQPGDTTSDVKCCSQQMQNCRVWIYIYFFPLHLQISGNKESVKKSQPIVYKSTWSNKMGY